MNVEDVIRAIEQGDMSDDEFALLPAATRDAVERMI